MFYNIIEECNMVDNIDVDNEEKISDQNGVKNSFVKNVDTKTIECVANITELDLSNDKLLNFHENLELPPNIVHLKLSNNKLTEVPPKVLKLSNLKTLDLSSNLIVFFNDTPSFCHTVEWLNLSDNRLKGPPFWVWTEKPNKLTYLNLSNNKGICKSFTDGYFEELVQYTTLVSEIDVHNCKLDKYVKFMSTFSHAKVITVGSEDYDCMMNKNNLEQLPCAGLEDCREVENLNLCNTHLNHINSNIDIYKNLKEINLAQNNLYSLPNEFCNLKNLETCKLSCNYILYLPENMGDLTKLVQLYLDDNKLCMLPQTLNEIISLKILDVYNNELCEAFIKIDDLEQVDFAQNYFEEPNDEEYLLKKEKFRANCLQRNDGRKTEVVEEYSNSSDISYNEELDNLASEECDAQDMPDTRCSTPEDWDSDDYWIPMGIGTGSQYFRPVTPPVSPWLLFVRKKMEEGNFCPMDAHLPISIGDLVKYEKKMNPPVVVEVEGQFDNDSDDDS